MNVFIIVFNGTYNLNNIKRKKNNRQAGISICLKIHKKTGALVIFTKAPVSR